MNSTGVEWSGRSGGKDWSGPRSGVELAKGVVWSADEWVAFILFTLKLMALQRRASRIRALPHLCYSFTVSGMAFKAAIWGFFAEPGLLMVSEGPSERARPFRVKSRSTLSQGLVGALFGKLMRNRTFWYDYLYKPPFRVRSL